MLKITKRWNLLRLLRLILGIAILAQGFNANDVILILVGAVFGGMAIANIGCSKTRGCRVNATPYNSTRSVNYEELDNKQ